MDLVTGATGFIGSHILHRLLTEGRQVRAVFRDRRKIEITKKIFSYYGSSGNLADRAEWVEGDITDIQSVTENMEGIGNVFHAAGLVSYASCDRKLLDTVNSKGTANVVNACLEKSVRRLIHLSSVASLGNVPGVKSDENSMWKHSSFKSDYSVSKYRGEMEVWRGINEGLSAVIVNPSVVIGPGAWLTAAGPLFDRVSKGLKYYPVGAAGYVDVRDVAGIMVTLSDMEIEGERFILNSENISHREVIGLIADVLGTPRPEYDVTAVLGKVACGIETVRSKIAGKRPRITTSALETASDVTSYNNEKISNLLKTGFISVKDSIDFSVKIYKKEKGLISMH